MAATSTGAKPRLLAPRILAAFLAVIGATLLWGGAQLLGLGGSPYYAMAGLLVAASALALWRGSWWGVWLYAAMVALTVIWALWEAGLDGWALTPRLAGPLVIGIWVALPMTWRALAPASLRPSSARALGLLLAALTATFAFGAGSFDTHAQTAKARAAKASKAAPPPTARAAAAPAPQDEWRYFGANLAGTRFAAFATQINPENVGKLKKAWEIDLRLTERSASRFEITPIQVGPTLYACAPDSVVLSIDGDTGKVKWRFDPNLDLKGYMSKVCRTISYWKAAKPLPECTARILASTVDARLMALDAETGRPCRSFGKDGYVDLLEGMGAVKRNFHYSSSGPLVAGGVAVLGGWISDGQETNEPSGVIRAFDVVTGKFAWAFDPEHPDRHTAPPPGETYARGTPNAWGVFSADEKLGMVYVPTGNATPDYWGAHRSKNSERFSSSVVALDLATGAVRWSFQTVHHDIWDYDVGAQPVLVDLPGTDGVIPALLQPTKRGQIFTLDRRTGAPIDPVEERPVPQGAAEGDFTAPTQPYPTRMPPFTGERLTEKDMWGLTPIDQMWCRIAFRKLRYDGQFTPPSVKGSLEYPGYIGGINWGSVSVQQDTRTMVVNASRLANRVQLIPRAEADKRGWKAADETGKYTVPMAMGAPQMGTPFGVTNGPFRSPLGVPCQEPPYTTLSAVDLDTHKVLWSRPLGTAKGSGPFGLRSGLPIALGAPMIGGTMVTKTGLIFFAGSQDGMIRAIDLKSGKELWAQDLPFGAAASPMTFVSPASGKQYVVVASGGAVGQKPKGQHIVAYALP